MTIARTGKRFVVLANGARLRIHGVRDGKFIVSRCDVMKWDADRNAGIWMPKDAHMVGSQFAVRMEEAK